MMTTRQGRGRPRGSNKPAELRRRPKGHRFTPATLGQIQQGLKLAKNEQDEIPTETAFLEEAIAHYVAFLGNTQQENIHQEQTTNQEVQRLQHQVSYLEHELNQAKAAIEHAEAKQHILENQLRRAQRTARQVHQPEVIKAPEPKRIDLHKAYQIKIRHEPHQACPPLPEGFEYDESELTRDIREKNWRAHDDTIHTVLTQQWPIARMRKEVERLKRVPGITKIWIAKNGKSVMIVSGIPSDSWVKEEGGRWDKE